jgi:hypothetical protein
MDTGFLIFFVLMSSAFLVLWVLDVYLGSRFHAQRRLDKIKRLEMMRRTEDD